VAAMADVFALSDMQSSPTAWKFEGGPRAEAPVSFFLTHTPPGKGPGRRGGPGPAGHVVVVPAETPHGFKNHGEGTLHQVSIHPHPEVVQTWLEDD
jgi:hypothetical protein